MFSLGYTKSHLLIYTKKLLGALDDKVNAGVSSREYQQVLGQIAGVINNIVLQLEGEVPILLARMAIFYDFLRMFDYNLIPGRQMPEEFLILEYKEILKDYKAFVCKNLATSDSEHYVFTYKGVLSKKLLCANALNKFCSELIESINMLVTAENLSEELIYLLYERRIIIQNIQKMIINNEFHCFTTAELHSYYEIIMETQLDSFSLRDSFNINELRARNQELQLYLKDMNENLSYSVDLETLSSQSFCEEVISWVNYIYSWFANNEVNYNENQLEPQVTPVAEVSAEGAITYAVDFSFPDSGSF